MGGTDTLVHYNEAVPGLRFAYLLALAVWLGGLIVLAAVAAPSVFEILQARIPLEGRPLAGAVFGAVLTRFHVLAYGCGVIMLVALVVMALIGPRPRPFAPRLTLIGAMLVVTIVVAIPITDRIEALQAAVPGAIADLPSADARRTTFERLHGLSSLLLSANALSGLLLVFWEAREKRL